MKWGLTITFLVLIAAFLYLGYIAFSVFTNIDDVNNCSTDIDCIVLTGTDLCKTPVSVNKDYAYRWNKKSSYTQWLYDLTNARMNCKEANTNLVASCEKNKCSVLSK